MTNAQLKRLISKIEVDRDGNVDICMRLIGELGLDEAVLIEGTDDNADDIKNGVQKNLQNATNTHHRKTIPNRNNRT